MVEIMTTIKPKHLENILNGRKLWEIRKTIPHDGMPFKVYCCESGSGGTIKGDFIVDMFQHIKPWEIEPKMIDECCVNIDDIDAYARGKEVYLWHISSINHYEYYKNIAEFGVSRPPQSWQYITRN